MLFDGGFTFTNFAADLLAVFLFILWFWLLITVAGDLFRRTDVSGFAKILWVILLIVLPYLGIFLYLLTQGRGMAHRNDDRIKRARDDLRQIVGYSVADEIVKLEKLKSERSITEQEVLAPSCAIGGVIPATAGTDSRSPSWSGLTRRLPATNCERCNPIQQPSDEDDRVDPRVKPEDGHDGVGSLRAVRQQQGRLV